MIENDVMLNSCPPKPCRRGMVQHLTNSDPEQVHDNKEECRLHVPAQEGPGHEEDVVDLSSREILLYKGPVHKMVKEGLNKVWAAVLVIQIIGVLPHIYGH